ncbi:MAG: exodeoxyribonuclease VII small subunit [Chlamydiae bacterium]|nr:exodeoxyribonuclease VII small subunit [Chlamydiota bacterium]
MTQENTLTFEEAYSRLEEILEKMNSGKQSLEDSLSLYEEADSLISFCNKRLFQAEQKIETLIKNREGDLALSTSGSAQTEDFSPSTYSTLKSRD